jgi:signal transduction histidine kinase
MMTRSFFIMPWHRACLGLLLAATMCCAAATGPERVLKRNSLGRGVAPFGTAAAAFRSISYEFGLGPIGGRLFQEIEVGARGARAAIRILGGAAPESIPPQILGGAAPDYDWRELERRGAGAARPPAGSTIQFPQPGFWEHYRWPIAGTMGFCLLQAALLIGLLVNRAKRLQGKAEVTLIADISARFVNLAPGEVDREIVEAQRRICELLGLDLAALWQWSMETPRIVTMTHLYRPLGGPPLPAPMYAHEHFPWSQQQLEAGRLIRVSSLAQVPAEAARDREVWRHLGIKAILTFPLAPGGAIIGALSFNTMRRERAWPDGLVKRLQLVAQIFSNALERKWAEEAFRTSEARLAAGVELAGLGYYEVDFGELATFADERFHAICGVPAGHHRGLQALEFGMAQLHPDDRQIMLDERARLHDGRIDRISIEYRYLHPGTGEKWIHHLAGVVTRSATGCAVRTCGVVRDITPYKRAELEAQELRGNLTHLARVNSLGALSGSLAHELNQPLGVILSNAQAAQAYLLQDPPDVTEVQAILADIVAADRRAGEVIERLRALLKRGQLSLQPLLLNQVIEGVLHLVRADLSRRGVTAVCELAPDLPLIAGDHVQLQQLVLNLILNAADAMATNDPGMRRLRLQTRLDQNKVRASVRDEGSGLPRDAERLFQPFYTTKPQGLGLGLAICRSIVAAHHGQLWAEPHPEGGAVFHFELPVAGSPDPS